MYKNLEPSKLKYIDLEFILGVDNERIIKKERIYVEVYPAGLRLPGSWHMLYFTIFHALKILKKIYQLNPNTINEKLVLV